MAYQVDVVAFQEFGNALFYLLDLFEKGDNFTHPDMLFMSTFDMAVKERVGNLVKTFVIMGKTCRQVTTTPPGPDVVVYEDNLKNLTDAINRLFFQINTEKLLIEGEGRSSYVVPGIPIRRRQPDEYKRELIIPNIRNVCNSFAHAFGDRVYSAFEKRSARIDMQNQQIRRRRQKTKCCILL